jgi:hypothetical protein
MKTTQLTLHQELEADVMAQRREELAALEAEIAQREPFLAQLQADLLQFERIYLGVVGSRYDDLAKIEQEIARLQGLTPEEDLSEEGEEGASLGEDAVGCGQNRFHAEKLKRLYREVARKFHPDLVQCEIERHHRHQLMVEANHAYQAGAEDRLQELLVAGETLEVASQTPQSAEMIVLLRRISESRSLLSTIEGGIEEILSSELFKLKQRVAVADTVGVNLLDELVSQVDRQIRKANNRLEHLQVLFQQLG